jgi:hypothetical protein
MEESITVERHKGFFSTLGTADSLRHLPKFLEDTDSVG